jgi:hypothetical protein
MSINHITINYVERQVTVNNSSNENQKKRKFSLAPETIIKLEKLVNLSPFAEVPPPPEVPVAQLKTDSPHSKVALLEDIVSMMQSSPQTMEALLKKRASQKKQKVLRSIKQAERILSAQIKKETRVELAQIKKERSVEVLRKDPEEEIQSWINLDHLNFPDQG